MTEPIDLLALIHPRTNDSAVLVSLHNLNALIAQLRAALRVVEAAQHLLKFPNKALIPWTEWSDLRIALAELETLK